MDLPPITTTPPAKPLAAARPTGPQAEREARAAAEAFEAAFLAEMLGHGGINRTPAGFGGGAGEDAFGSLLTAEYARLIAERGGIGLAERIFQSIRQTTAAKDPAP